MIEFEYLTDKNGKPKPVVIPIEVWQKITTTETVSETELSEGIEEYCLNKAMDEGKNSPLFGSCSSFRISEEIICKSNTANFS